MGLVAFLDLFHFFSAIAEGFRYMISDVMLPFAGITLYLHCYCQGKVLSVSLVEVFELYCN
jgi:hypothetical protein